MAHERGTGIFVKMRYGGGQEVTTYGGSVHLLSASRQNQRLHRAGTRELGHLDTQQDFLVKNSLAKRHSARETLHRLQDELKNVTYLDGHRRGKPRSQWDTRLKHRPPQSQRRRNVESTPSRPQRESDIFPQIGPSENQTEETLLGTDVHIDAPVEVNIDAAPDASTREGDVGTEVVRAIGVGSTSDRLPVINLRRALSLLEMRTPKAEYKDVSESVAVTMPSIYSASRAEDRTRSNTFALDGIRHELSRLDLGMPGDRKNTRKRQITWVNNRKGSTVSNTLRGSRNMGQEANAISEIGSQSENHGISLPVIVGVSAYTIK